MMKKFVLFFFLLLLSFGLGFEAAKWNPFKKQVPEEPKNGFLGLSFAPSRFPLKSRPFTILIVGRNNGGNVAKTLHSVFAQNYPNFRLMYIDDASDDGSFDLVRDLTYNRDCLCEVSLLQNEEKLGLMGSLFRAVQTCPDEEIVAVLGGEDWLAHEWVLEGLNRYYADPDLWLTYGGSADSLTFQKGPSRAFQKSEWKEKGFRGHPFVSSHLKTFYAALFKKIDEADCIFQGRFLLAAAEMAYMIPMLEMAEDHFQFIDEILYISNRQHLILEDRGLQVSSERFIRSLQPYAKLTRLELQSAGPDEVGL